MGRWLEIDTRGPSGQARDRSGVIAQIGPHVLLAAADALPSTPRGEFPRLAAIANPSNYQDESLWLDPSQVLELREEFGRMRRLVSYQEFRDGVDGAAVLKYWRGRVDSKEFSAQINEVHDILDRAVVSRAWAHFMW